VCVQRKVARRFSRSPTRVSTSQPGIDAVSPPPCLSATSGPLLIYVPYNCFRLADASFGLKCRPDTRRQASCPAKEAIGASFATRTSIRGKLASFPAGKSQCSQMFVAIPLPLLSSVNKNSSILAFFPTPAVKAGP